MSQLISHIFFKALLVLSIIFYHPIYAQKADDIDEANRFFKKGDSLLYYRNFKLAIQNYEEAKQIYERNQDWNQVIASHNKLSENYMYTFNLPKALHHTEQALQIIEQKTDINPKQKARAWDNMGAYYMKGKSDLDLSLEYFEKAFQLRSESFTDEDEDFARSHYNFGTVKTYKGLYEEAMDHFNKAIEIRKKKANEDPIEIAEIYRQMGNALFEQGLYDETLVYLKKALAIANKIYKPDNFYFVDLYNNIGLMYSYKKEENRSLEYYIKSLHLSELQLGVDHPDQVRMHYNIANIYYFQKNNDKALFHVDKTITIGIKAFGEDFPNLALPYSLKGLVIRGEEGIVYVKKALILARKAYGEDNVRTAYFHTYLSELYHEIGQYKRANEYAQKSLDIRLKVFGEHSFYTVESYIMMATFEIDKKEFNNALNYLEKAITANKQLKSSGVGNYGEFDMFLSLTRLLKSLERKAFTLKSIYEKGNDPKILEESINTYEKAGRLVETIRRTQYNKEDKLTFAKDVKNVFYGGIATQLLSDTGNEDEKIEKAFNYAERSKANLLKELLNDANAKGFSGLPEKLLNLEQSLRKELADAKSAFYATIGKENTDQTKVSDIESKITDISRRQDSLKEVLEKKYSKYYQLKYDNNTLSIKEIQKRLQENTTLLEYFMVDSTLYAFVITKNDAGIKELSISEIDKKIEAFRSSILLKNKVEYKRLGYALFNELLAPMKDQIIGNQLIIIPDESLWHLNFDLLLTSDVKKENNSKLSYLIKEYAVSYANSASLLFDEGIYKSITTSEIRKECLAFSFSNEDSLSVGNQMDLEVLRDAHEDLPGTRKEIKKIATIVKGRYFFGSQAIEQNFKNNLSDYNVLHLALHGEVDDQNPENSRIYFTKTEDSLEDNILYSHELYALNIPAELTVLSACNTGMGKIAKGEGVLSLGTAFQYAGTKSLLLTGWEVSDKTTPEIMQNFYSNLSQGMNKAEALQQAKLKFLQTTDVFTQDPVYWGGFYLVGNYDAIEFEKPIHMSWIFYGLIGLITLGVFFYMKRKSIKSLFQSYL
ncbi:CHAT domain-containing protein [Aquimarina sp. EL_43]|uniref:CHAT domain-containing protein n=1 Tax=unclassified Aquimarina TaxID=2627091 RepID=UPI0018C94C44|nr:MULTISPECIES: CHAT domain-containing tetratricopeptide repeat protein [unclassified Aquimarina]MBG6130370.1 CHAT domain-containing protein [Aquimarina sp. EL_35]MBG6149150.1 CHAT domain-containing protein [Aquimarina sp. EL_32]MBG6168476.1 CHAT domain-containing protein [Aquimarina sp. EL_43]